MPFERPTIQTIIDRIQSDIESRLPGSDPRLRRNLLFILAKVLAGAIHHVYGYLTWLSKQFLPDTAEAADLDRHAAIWLEQQRLAPIASSGDITFTGTNDITIPAGTQLQTSDGLVYETEADATIVGGTATASVTAQEPGSAGNQDVGVSLTLLTPVAGVNSNAVVAAGGIAGGSDQEDDESLRSRILRRIQEPPQGGAAHDYVAWAHAAHPDVTDVWVVENGMGYGTVVVYIMTYGATANGIPAGPVLTAVEDYIEARRPVCADVLVAAPTPIDLDFTIEPTPDTAAVRAAIQAELEDFVRRVASPEGITVLLTQINESISLADGETDHDLTVPAGNMPYDIGEIPVMGEITWV
jgi:uncharacterized phage protein gp47/JayE